jgi:5-methylthioadenosine/S-adenosylhomocysteine deaminase
MPGLINGHTHVSMTLFRGIADDLPLMEWLTGHIFPRERHLTAEVVELGALLGCAEMLRTGVTAFADRYLMENAVAAAVERGGLRCLMGEGIFSFPSPAYSSVNEGYALVREQAERYRGNSRIRVAVMPHSVYTTTPEILAACRDLAAELHVPLCLHLAETSTEVENCLASFGKRPVAYCRDLELLSPATVIAHGVHLDDGELDILAASGARIVHNPRSNMKLASGVAPLPAMLARGMLPGLGTDGAASNNSLNLFAEMSACALLHKAHSGDPTVCPAQTVFDMATLGSAAALGWPELGRLVPGAPADMIALDLDSPNLQPLYNPISHLVYAASGHEVCMTMVEGRIVYQNGSYRTLDHAALLREVRKLRRWILDAV